MEKDSNREYAKEHALKCLEEAINLLDHIQPNHCMEAELAELKSELERLKDIVDKLTISSRRTLEDEFSRASVLISDLHIAAEKTGNKNLEKLFAHILELVLGKKGAQVTLEVVSYKPTGRSGIKSAKNHARHCLEFDLAKNHALKCLEEAIEEVDNIQRNLQ